MYNAPLIGIDDVKIFELGNTFWIEEPKPIEHFSLAIGVGVSGKKKIAKMREELPPLLESIRAFLNPRNTTTHWKEAKSENIVSSAGVINFTPFIFELNFDELIKDLQDPSEYEPLLGDEKSIRYQTLSTYPFIVRDIAMFVPVGVSESAIEDTIKKDAGELVVRFSQFDKFHKEGEERISYGYRLVFQSFERTLTDDEVNAVMEKVTKACTDAGFEVR